MRDLITRSASPKRSFPNSGFKIFGEVEKLEEEKWEWYERDLFYPVHIGEIFQSQYQALGKLGYGTRSTAWLCRDLTRHKYVAMKVCEQDSPAIRRELAAYRYLDTIKTSSPGALLVRELVDSFKATGPAGEHQCFIHEPLGVSIETLRQLSPGRKLPQDLLKAFLVHLLYALDFIHTDANMIHTDLQARNIHLKIEDDSILKEFESAELTNPSPRKINGDRIIYESRGLRQPKMFGRPILCDFGEARFGKDTYTDDIQPYVYRAPEIILDIPWTYSVDIWNVGVMTWDIFENKNLFHARNGDGQQLSLYHLAEMVAVLGLPPLEYLQRTKTSQKYFDDTGNWIGAFEIPDLSLENSEEQLEGENKASFLDFIRKMLRWVPEERQTAKQLLAHPWLRSAFK